MRIRAPPVHDPEAPQLGNLAPSTHSIGGDGATIPGRCGSRTPLDAEAFPSVPRVAQQGDDARLT